MTPNTRVSSVWRFDRRCIVKRKPKISPYLFAYLLANYPSRRALLTNFTPPAQHATLFWRVARLNLNNQLTLLYQYQYRKSLNQSSTKAKATSYQDEATFRGIGHSSCKSF